MANKSYIVDTNILIDDDKCIENLRNGEENGIFIPNTVIEELDRLKDKKPHLKHRIFAILNEIDLHKDDIQILYSDKFTSYDNKDNKIIEEIQENINMLENPIFVTNDKILKFKAYKHNINSEHYKRQIPFKHESEKYTGFVDAEKENLINNCFFWDKGKLKFYSSGEEKLINYLNEPWKIQPKNHYQNCFLDLVLNKNIDIVSVQSEGGFGKTFLALASALYLVFEKKKYNKIYVFKSNYEIGNELGYLPGPLNEKMYPYFRPIKELIGKLINYRQLPNKAFDEKNDYSLNPDYIEFLPINYMRGANLENAVVILEEIQNLSRSELRTMLTRLDENVKCICTGDIYQSDNPYLSKENNGMNWLVKLFKGSPNYGHIVLKGKSARGPICQLAIDRGL